MRGKIGAAVEPEHRYDATGEERLHDLGVGVVFPVPVGRAATGRLAAQNRALQATKALARLDAELIECVACGRDTRSAPPPFDPRSGARA